MNTLLLWLSGAVTGMLAVLGTVLWASDWLPKRCKEEGRISPVLRNEYDEDLKAIADELVELRDLIEAISKTVYRGNQPVIWVKNERVSLCGSVPFRFKDV